MFSKEQSKCWLLFRGQNKCAWAKWVKDGASRDRKGTECTDLMDMFLPITEVSVINMILADINQCMRCVCSVVWCWGSNSLIITPYITYKSMSSPCPVPLWRTLLSVLNTNLSLYKLLHNLLLPSMKNALKKDSHGSWRAGRSSFFFFLWSCLKSKQGGSRSGRDCSKGTAWLDNSRCFQDPSPYAARGTGMRTCSNWHAVCQSLDTQGQAEGRECRW